MNADMHLQVQKGERLMVSESSQEMALEVNMEGIQQGELNSVSQK